MDKDNKFKSIEQAPKIDVRGKYFDNFKERRSQASKWIKERGILAEVQKLKVLMRKEDTSDEKKKRPLEQRSYLNWNKTYRKTLVPQEFIQWQSVFHESSLYIWILIKTQDQS